jgi:hypothetical protein
MSGIRDEELQGLSDEEREALAEDDGAEARELLTALLEDDAEEEETAPAAEGQAPAGESAPLPAAAPGEDGAAGQPAEGATVAPNIAGPNEFHALYHAPEVKDYTERMARVAEFKRGLLKSYEAGDLDLEQYEAKREEAEAVIRDLSMAKLKHELAVEQKAQFFAQRWQWEQERFYAQAANKAYREDPVIGPAFAAAVQVLAADANNNARPMSWFLEEADRMTRARFRVPGEGAGAPSPAARQTASGARRPPGTGRERVPPTLAGVPAATIPETGGDEFSRLDRLEGMDLEAALARLSPAEADRYLLARAA